MMAQSIYKQATQEVDSFKREGVRPSEALNAMLNGAARWKLVKALIIGLMIIERIEEKKCEVPLRQRWQFPEGRRKGMEDD